MSVGLTTNKKRTSYRIDECTKDIQRSLQNDPVETHALIQVLEAVEPNTVYDGDDARYAETDKHKSAIRPPFRSAKVFEPRNDKAAEAKKRDLLWSGLSPTWRYAQGRGRLTMYKYTVISAGWQYSP